MRKSLLAVVLVFAALLTGAASATAGYLPGPVHGTVLGGTHQANRTTPVPVQVALTCTYRVSSGRLTITASDARTRNLTVRVINNARTMQKLTRTTIAGTYSRGVYRTYTAANVTVWVSGVRCQA